MLYDGLAMERFAFLFADLAGFTALTEAHGDLDAANVALRFAEMARATLGSEATVVKTIGDAVMVVSPDAGCAVRCAIGIRGALRREPSFLAVRIGIHCGSAVERGGDYFGAAVNLAARVAAHAEAAQILCTDAIAKEAAGVEGVEFRDAGAVHLKNIVEPVVLYEVIISSDSASRTAIDPVCRMTIDQSKPIFTASAGGVEYQFCSRKCADAFIANPDAYLAELSRQRP
jgi:class 3 adenylate cyclase/YHS domain-containing protein